MRLNWALLVNSYTSEWIRKLNTQSRRSEHSLITAKISLSVTGKLKKTISVELGPFSMKKPCHTFCFISHNRNIEATSAKRKIQEERFLHSKCLSWNRFFDQFLLGCYLRNIDATTHERDKEYFVLKAFAGKHC